MIKMPCSFLSALLVLVCGVTSAQEQPQVLELESLKTPPASPAQLQLAIESWQTPQGSQVLFLRSAKLPMFDVRVVFDAGSARDDGASGLAQLTTGMLDEGTTQRNDLQIAEGFDEIGAKFQKSVHLDYTYVSVRSLSSEPHRDKAVALLAEVLGQPQFAEDKLQLIKDQMNSLSARNNDYAMTKALTQLYAHTYAGHPYASPKLGTPQTLEALKVADLQAFHQHAFNAENALITLVGDLTQEQARDIATQLSTALPGGTALPPLQEPTTFEPEIYHLEHPGAQSLLLMAIPGVGIDHPDAPALTLANLILGGGSTSRLFEQLRTRRGLTYSASSHLLQPTGTGIWVFNTQVQAKYQEGTVALLEDLLQEYADNGPTKQQFIDAKNKLRGVYLRESVSNEQLSQILMRTGVHQLPLDYRQAFIEQVQTLTLDELNVALKKHLKLDKLVRISVGHTVEQHPLPEQPAG